MNLNPTQESLSIVENLSKTIQTFHHHYHILYDIANQYYGDKFITYVEIGAYCGGSASLMMYRNNTKIISIDIGDPIDPRITIDNVESNNKHENFYRYILGNSQNGSTIDYLKEILDGDKIDILFIDGDHSYDGIVEDFNNYVDFVNDGGFIVFDDYNDIMFSPEVKIAVNDIVSTLDLSKYSVMGSIKNEYSAKPVELLENNCFIVRKI
jgi:predicted O-methyltransferase YrrM